MQLRFVQFFTMMVLAVGAAQSVIAQTAPAYRYNGLAPGIAPPVAAYPYGYRGGYPVPVPPSPAPYDPYPVLEAPPPGWAGAPPVNYAPAKVSPAPQAHNASQAKLPPKAQIVPRPRPQVVSLVPQAPQPQVPQLQVQMDKPVSVARRPGVPFTCAEGEKIVTGLGFTDTKASDCEARILRYRAMRDGKAYEVRVSAMNGEVTEVRKLP